jgi:putative endonuclease
MSPRPARPARARSEPTLDPRRALGRRGEELAVRYLRRRGFAVVARNVRSARGEIDLIAFDGTTLAFVEVKTRRLTTRASDPREDQLPLGGLGIHQRTRLRRLAAAWLAEEHHPRPFAQIVRFDAIGVVLDGAGRLRRVEHIEDAW